MASRALPCRVCSFTGILIKENTVTAPSLTKNIEEKKDRVSLRLYNTIAIFDIYVAAHTPEAAREALIEAIKSGELKPSEMVAKEVTMPGSIRSSWVDEKPWVAPDVTDEEFESLKGSTTMQAYEKLYTKTPQPK
jgi:hypothetical protein